jgi:hypothetical protein
MSLDEELKRVEGLEWPLEKQVNAFYSASILAAKFAEDMIIPVLRGQLGLSPREGAITGTYFRMYAWMKTLEVLNSSMHYQAVTSAARTLFESMLDLKILIEDTTGAQIQRFLAFPTAEKYRVAKKLLAFHDANPGVSDRETGAMRAFVDAPGKAAEVELLRQANWGVDRHGKPIRPKHWTGKNMDERARDAGKQYETWYVELWSMLSWHMHSGSVGYVGLSESGMHALFGKSHRHAQLFFLNGTVMCAKAMKVSKAIDGFSDFIGRLETMPGEIMLKEQLEFIRKQAQESAGNVG